ncbi:UBP5-like protein [Mya arenaria]|uniref:ubiquitinyl hydrolase 1 n=1 Tax=Mya arenaria TaxID=6604 RepID=A0ABY7FYL5_MYAAR|nr:uncharacterized protein LOC128218599 [Mya arenaria]WAR26014.1 UBP5-like protein [Mya arenaria]
MWWLIGLAYRLIADSIIDFIFFILIDAVAKNPIKEARSPEEKRRIWLWESLILGFVCLMIYALDHTPYVGLALTFATLLYTQLLNRLDIRYWWRYLFERWEEHQQHTENIQLINEKQKRMELWRKFSMQTPVSKPVLSRLSDFITRKAETNMTPIQQTPVFSLNKMYMPQQGQQPHANAVNSYATVSTTNNIVTSVAPPSEMPGFATRQVQSSQQSFAPTNAPVFTSTQNSKQSVFQADSSPIRPVTNWFTKTDLKRRPLGTYDSRNNSPYTFSSTRTGIRQRFMSAFGFNEREDKPAGLRNEGQNLCFLNCILQCLANTPHLVDQLYAEINKDLDCSEAESTMIASLAEILAQCQKTKTDGVLDPTLFRESVATLDGRLVCPPTEKQHQQDTAEFFMWLMESLHGALNKKSCTEMTVEKGSSMETLKFIYGDLNEKRVNDLKQGCRREIEAANGLNIESYAEPIQRLSDLEWLTHKQVNNSVVDNLFTGQLVEAYHCLVDNHLTVSTQTFNILPVPIVSPRDVSGLVHLEDCFTKFCNIEHLAVTDGFQCSQCQKNSNIQGPLSTAQRNTRSALKGRPMNSHGSVDSAFQSTVLSPSSCMSPIPRQEGVNDSGFQDNVFRTSTPVNNEMSRFLFPSRHIRETERRCLLKQLPECLVIQLMRFSYNQFSQQCRKISSAISIPIKGLDLTDIVFDNVTNREDMSAEQKVKKYDLYGICVHLGAETTHFGHYICYCLAGNGTWYKFDDELVWEVNIEYEMTTREIRENAYLLFYKRAKDSV